MNSLQSNVTSNVQGCDLTKVTNPEKWMAGLGLPLVWRTKPPEPHGCLILEDLQTPHSHKQKTRRLDTIQATCLIRSMVATSLL